MVKSSDKDQVKKQIPHIQTFPVPFSLGEIKDSISISTNNNHKPSKEKLINQAFKFHSQGNISEAAKYYHQLINQKCNDDRVFSNYGVLLKNLGKLQEAEVLIRKAIELNPNNGMAFSNLGLILKNLGKLQDARLCSEKIMTLRSWSIIGSYSFNYYM